MRQGKAIFANVWPPIIPRIQNGQTTLHDQLPAWKSVPILQVAGVWPVNSATMNVVATRVPAIRARTRFSEVMWPVPTPSARTLFFALQKVN